MRAALPQHAIGGAADVLVGLLALWLLPERCGRPGHDHVVTARTAGPSGSKSRRRRYPAVTTAVSRISGDRRHRTRGLRSKTKSEGGASATRFSHGDRDQPAIAVGATWPFLLYGHPTIQRRRFHVSQSCLSASRIVLEDRSHDRRAIRRGHGLLLGLFQRHPA